MKVVYESGMERSEERESFWEELKGCIKAYEDRGRALVIVIYKCEIV